MKTNDIGDGVRVIYLENPLNALAENAITGAYNQAAGDSVHTLILSFSAITGINLSGINILVRLHTLARRHGQDLAAVGLAEKYHRIFRDIGLTEGITVYENEAEALGAIGISDDEALYWDERDYLADLYAPPGDGRMLDAANWSIPSADLATLPNTPVEGFPKIGRVSGPLQGFGSMWEKTYLMPLGKIKLIPARIIDTLKENLPAFSPSGSRFCFRDGGISPGAIVSMETLAGGMYSAALVLHSDASSFTLITLKGHPKSGWVTFTAYRDGGNTVVQIQELSRSSDPMSALALGISGANRQEYLWRHILEMLAAHLKVESDIYLQRTCWDPRRRWAGLKNIWYNAQLRSLPDIVSRLFRRRKVSP